MLTVLIKFMCKHSCLLHSYDLVGHSLLDASEFRYLRLLFTSNLIWSQHIKSICAKSLRKMAYIKRTLKQSTVTTKLTAYKALVRPILEYCAVVWDPYLQTGIYKLDRVRNMAVTFTFNKYCAPQVQHLCQNFNPSQKGENWEDCNCRIKITHSNNVTFHKKYLTFSDQSSTQGLLPLNTVPFQTRVNSLKYSLFPHTTKEWNRSFG